MVEVTLSYVTDLAMQLSAVERQQLIERLKSHLVATKDAPAQGKQLRSLRGVWQASAAGELEPKPRDLYGIWRDKFPDDLDLDKELYEIRHEWEKELEEFGL